MRKFKFFYFLFLLVIFFITIKCSSLNQISGPSEIPNLVKPEIYTELPSCISSTNQLTLAKTLIDDYLSFYRPIPLYVNFAEKSLKQTQALIDTIFNLQLPLNYSSKTETEELYTNLTNETNSYTFTIIFKNFKENSDFYLSYTYDKDNGKINGILNFVNYNEKVAINTQFNILDSLNKDIFLKYYVAKEINTTEPDFIKINFKLKDSLIYISGSSFHPYLLIDSLTTKKLNIYSFRSISNRLKNYAIMDVALLPNDTNAKFSDYKIDDLIIKNYLIKINASNNETLQKAILWSTINNKPIPLDNKNLILWNEILNIPLTKKIEKNDLLEFFELNKKNLKEFKDFEELYFIMRTKQPIFLTAQAKLAGNIFDSIPQLNSLDVSNIQAFNPKDIVLDREQLKNTLSK